MEAIIPSKPSVMNSSANMQHYSKLGRIPEYGLSSFIKKMEAIISFRNVGYEVNFKHAVLFYTA
jgi:hypothetical protein